MPITHSKVSAVSDGGDTTLVRPSDWNANHTGSLVQPFASGTSFPGGPATNDFFFRTDRGLLYYYDGTRWLTVTLYEHFLGQMTGISATSTEVHSPVWAGLYDQYLVDLITVMFAASGLSGTAYWTIEAYSYDAGSGSLLATTTNQSGTNAQYAYKRTAINALIGTGADSLSTRAVKTSTPGNFTGGSMITYRLVG